MSSEEKSASQFISALVKNLQAVCHGNVEFDKNVKVVGHLFLTVDSATEFNYIVNEKVSKSDESSTTFISKSFYATDPQQKTPKKNLDRPLPPPTPNVLGKTRYDISVDLTDEPGGGRPMMHQRGQFSRPQGYPGSLNRNPQMRRRPFDQNRIPPHQMAKMPRLTSPQRQSMNLSSLSPRKMPTSPSQRINAPSTITSPSIPMSINPESVSATPAHSLPGADKPESDSTGSISDKTEKPDIKFEIIKVENGNVVASNKNKTDGDEGQLKIESVTSHDLSIDTASTGEKDSEDTTEGDSSQSDKPPDIETDKQTSDIDNNTAETESEMDMQQSDSSEQPAETPSKSRAPSEPDVIEIDLTSVKDEVDSVLDSESNYGVMDASSFQRHSFGAQGGDNSLSSFGGESNDDDFFNSLREQTVGLYPVGLHANESSNQSFSDIPSLPGQSQGAYMSVAGSSASPSSNQPVHPEDHAFKCLCCEKSYGRKVHLQRHFNSAHLDVRYKCPQCDKQFTRKDKMQYHYKASHTVLDSHVPGDVSGIIQAIQFSDDFAY